MKIGILSAAHLHVDAYIPILQSLPDVAVIGIADEDRARAEATAALFGVPVFKNYAALLADRPDAVVVCSENSRHRRWSNWPQGPGRMCCARSHWRPASPMLRP